MAASFPIFDRAKAADPLPPVSPEVARETAQAQAEIEHRVDAGRLKIRGTILRVTYSPASEDDGYLVRIEASDRKDETGKVVMIVQDRPGRLAGQPWPAAGKEALIYCVGTSPYMTIQNQPAVAPCYVPDRETAIIWAFSQ